MNVRLSQRALQIHLAGKRIHRTRRRGAIAVWAAFALVALVALVALAVDTGYLLLARNQLQNSADSAALAAANELLDQKLRGKLPLIESPRESAIRESATEFCNYNSVVGNQGRVSLSPEDVVIGSLSIDGGPNEAIQKTPPAQWNAVQVSISRTREKNGQVKTNFAPIINFYGADIGATATAAFWQGFVGFRIPSGAKRDPEPTLPFLPFALDVESWKPNSVESGTDRWKWDEERGRVTPGSDGLPEIKIYPLETGSGGNCGTVDIGGTNSNTPKLRRQIVEGISASDLEFHGGELKLGAQGTLTLSADPGLKAGAIEGELISVIGQPRIIPLYSSIKGSGNPAEYTIVGFAGIRIVRVKLRGSDKGVFLQPAGVVTRGGIFDDSGTSSESSYFIYSPVQLVR